jgi:L-threonylcarbamoyladenylate synthase
MKPRNPQRAGDTCLARSAEIINLREHPNPEQVVGQAARLLRQGKLVAVPTETVYGLLANADMPEAVERLSRVKGRAENRPYTYLIADAAVLAAEGAEISPIARRLIGLFWPGPLTVVLRVGDDWRGFRLPDHPLVRKIVRAAGCRVVAPSANRSGAAEPTTASDVQREIGERIDLILDDGPCRIGKPSTVVRVQGDRLEVLREGAIAGKEIEKAVRGVKRDA